MDSYYNDGADEFFDIMQEMRRQNNGGTESSAKAHNPGAKVASEHEAEESETAETYEKKYAGEAIWNPDVKVPRSWLKESKAARFVDNHVNVPYELLRKKTLSTIRKNFTTFCSAVVSEDNPEALHQAFEKWYFTSKSKEAKGDFMDPLLASKIDEGAEQVLANNLADLGRVAPATALSTARQVSKALTRANFVFKRQVSHFGYRFYEPQTKRRRGEKHVSKKKGVNMGNETIDESMIQLKYRKSKVRITVQHYEKLEALLKLRCGDGLTQKDERIFCLLSRYGAINGEHAQGAGFQAALPGSCFDVLLKHLDCRMECFASPLNCRYPKFCSAFKDTDAAFGSVGSFFEDFHPREGSFEANPPFVDGLIEKMAERMDSFLEDSSSGPLSFVVIIPKWDSTKGWLRLHNSKFLRRHICLKSREHGYTEGAQHVLHSRYRISTCDTSIFFLQNRLGKKKWKVSDELEEEIEKAFVSRHLKKGIALSAQGPGEDSSGQVKNEPHERDTTNEIDDIFKTSRGQKHSRRRAEEGGDDDDDHPRKKTKKKKKKKKKKKE
jgi:phosphorylated CTD-interacting factor 1